MFNIKPIATVFITSLSLMLGGAVFAADNASGTINMFGGPAYTGGPDLQITAALVKAGGGPQDFTFPAALVSMLGQKTVNAEVTKLTAQYGKESVDNFLSGMTFAVLDGLKRATEAGVTLPDAPDNLKGATLARALVQAGTTPDGTWWSGYLFDQVLSHTVHAEVMVDIDVKFSHEIDGNAHRLLNQAMYDVAQALGATHVKLAALH